MEGEQQYKNEDNETEEINQETSIDQTQDNLVKTLKEEHKKDLEAIVALKKKQSKVLAENVKLSRQLNTEKTAKYKAENRANAAFSELKITKNRINELLCSTDGKSNSDNQHRWLSSSFGRSNNTEYPFQHHNYPGFNSGWGADYSNPRWQRGTKEGEMHYGKDWRYMHLPSVGFRRGRQNMSLKVKVPQIIKSITCQRLAVTICGPKNQVVKK